MHRSFVTATICLASSLGVGGQLQAQGGETAGAPAGAPVVAVLDFTNSSLMDHAEYDPFRIGIAGLLTSDLSRNPEIVVVERERLREVLDELEIGASGRVDESTAARAGQLLGARHIIFGVFVIDRRGDLRIDARAVNVETSRVEHVETVTDDADNLLRAVRRLGQQLSNGLDLPAAASPPTSAEVPEAPSGQAQVNLKYARAMIHEDRGDVQKAIELYEEFLLELPEGYAPELRQTVEERVRHLRMDQ